MRTATGILRHDHEVISTMLEVTEALAGRLLQGEPVEPRLLDDALEFLQVFADRCHHGKEESVLFPELERNGLPAHGGPIGVMLHEHDVGRGFIGAMREAATAYRAEKAGSGAAWARAALGYVELLRQHIQKENEVLFVMAERMLSPADQERLAAEFDRVEKEQLGEGRHERMEALMQRLKGEVLGA